MFMKDRQKMKIIQRIENICKIGEKYFQNGGSICYTIGTPFGMRGHGKEGANDGGKTDL